MSKIFFFCIPAWGHTNPTIPVVEELVKRGHAVRYYSFEMFREKIEAAGAEFVSCDAYLPELNEKEMSKIKKVSTTQMTITDFETTARMDGMLSKDVETIKPDCVVADSVCFWGKLIARKYNLPFVCSTTTFAFNRYSSNYMQNSFGEMADMILGMPKVNRALKKLEPLGYHVKSALSLIQNDNDTNTIVYTSDLFQPCAETFSARYAFIGPSVKVLDEKHTKQESVDMQQNAAGSSKSRKQIYISMGTVVNERVKFYESCMEALKDLDADVVMSVGESVDLERLQEIQMKIQNKTAHFFIAPRVNQLEVLAGADVFLTHCGMNSVSESLYMGVPMVLYPQTGEQRAVAKRTFEMEAGIYLENDSSETIRKAVQQVLGSDILKAGALKMKDNFRNCPGAKGAADFIETVLIETKDKKK